MRPQINNLKTKVERRLFLKNIEQLPLRCLSSTRLRFSLSLSLSLSLVFKFFLLCFGKDQKSLVMAVSLIRLLVLDLIIAAIIPIALCQTEAPSPSPASDSCNGIFVSYAYTDGAQIPPNLKSDPTEQPYRFESTLTVLNNGLEELKSWRAFVGFQHNEYLVSASGAVLANGTGLPTNVGGGVVFAGYPSTDLKTAIETAGDVTQMQVQVKFLGTQFGVASPNVPMPTNVSLVNDGFVCSKPTMQGNAFFLFPWVSDSIVPFSCHGI